MHDDSGLLAVISRKRVASQEATDSLALPSSKSARTEERDTNRYAEIQSSLATTSPCRDLKQVIELFYAVASAPGPKESFAVAAPSGCGKTQLAVTLSGMKEFNVVLISLGNNATPRLRPTYTNVSEDTKELCAALDTDLKRCSTLALISASVLLDLSSIRLHTAGYLRQVYDERCGWSAARCREGLYRTLQRARSV